MNQYCLCYLLAFELITISRRLLVNRTTYFIEHDKKSVVWWGLVVKSEIAGFETDLLSITNNVLVVSHLTRCGAKSPVGQIMCQVYTEALHIAS